MSNADIFGYTEELTGERKDREVYVWKRHVRTAWDAAVPPGQSVGFEFYAARFPFEMVIVNGGDEVGTSARVAGGGATGGGAGARGAGGVGRGSRAAASATTRATAAATRAAPTATGPP